MLHKLLLGHFKRFKTELKSLVNKDAAVSKIRNIGIIAHVDAGKTTTTERILYYSGVTRRIGDVDKGNTMMDFLPEEKERGITITAACITFEWLGHRINLVDTPGHVDFGIEVERSLRVLDGAVTIIDAVAGVEAQTEAVWEKANFYGIPRIAFINKMDRVGASYENCIQEISSKLNAVPLPLSIPLFSQDGFVGVADLLNLQKIVWHGGNSHEYTASRFEDSESLMDKRAQLMEKVADLDDEFLEVFLGDQKQSDINKQLSEAIRRLCICNLAVPVLCGASFKNIGVQPLLDAIVEFLPSPLDNSPKKKQFLLGSNSENLWAIAYKVVNDAQRGILTFVRIYSGTLTSQQLYNCNRKCRERASKLYNVHADYFEPVNSITSGNIGVVVGLKNTFTGDTLTDISNCSLASDLPSILVPPPVYFCAIEPASPKDEAALLEALRILQLEDPSFKSELNTQTGQLTISGVGELHLEIIINRLRKDYKLDVSAGPVQPAYKESLKLDGAIHFTWTDIKIFGSKKAEVSFSFEIKSCPSSECTVEVAAGTIEENTAAAVRKGLLDALSYGPHYGYPVGNLHINCSRVDFSVPLDECEIGRCAIEALRSALKNEIPVVMEPVSLVEIKVKQSFLGAVLNDLSSKRNAEILEASPVERAGIVIDAHHVIKAIVPFSTLIGYASHLRSITAGAGSFSATPNSYKLKAN